MGKFTQRSDGRYVTSIMINGKRKYLYAQSEPELDIKLAKAKVNKFNGTFSTKDNICFKEYAESWFENNITIKEKATQNSIKNILNNHIYTRIGNIKIKDLKAYHIQSVVTEMIKENYKDITKRTLSTIKRILNDAMINDVIYKNVALGITTPKFAKIEKKPLSIKDDKIILNEAQNHKYGLFILIMRYCGLRCEEASSLYVTDIDLNKKILHVNKAFCFAQNQPFEKETKNLKDRSIPIPDILIELLEKEISFRKEKNIKYLFTKESNIYSPLTKTAIRVHLNSFLYYINEKNNTKIRFTYHQLRHSYCTMLYYAGIKIKKAQELMGHSSADMVYNIYTHLDEERENAEEIINGYINNTINI